MTLTVSWSVGSSARTWCLSLPVTAALAESILALAAVSRPNPATVKRALGIAEPFLALGAAAAGVGAPELLVVVAAVAASKCLLSRACPGQPEPAPTSSRATPGVAPCAARRVRPRRVPDPARLVDTTPHDARIQTTPIPRHPTRGDTHEHPRLRALDNRAPGVPNSQIGLLGAVPPLAILTAVTVGVHRSAGSP